MHHVKAACHSSQNAQCLMPSHSCTYNKFTKCLVLTWLCCIYRLNCKEGKVANVKDPCNHDLGVPLSMLSCI